MIISPISAEALEVAVTATHAEFAAQMVFGQYYMLISSTNCWFKQASPTATIVCDTNANMADGDTVTINDGINSAYVYEYDKAADGVTGGHHVWAAGTTAATVAANLATIINATQVNVTAVANVVSGTVTVTTTYGNLTTTKSSSSAMTVAYTPIATAAAGSMYLPANVIVVLDGRIGSDVSILRDTADGKATLTRTIRY